MSALNPEKTKSTDIKSKRPSFETPPPLRQNGASLLSLRPNLLPPLLPTNPAKKSKSTRDKSKITVKKSKSTACLPTNPAKKSKSTRDKSILPALNPEKTKSTDIKSKRPSFETPPPLRQNGASLPSLRPNLLTPLLPTNPAKKS